MAAGEADTEKSERPDNTAFKQQRLPAWQPVLTAAAVLPVFFIVGLFFIPIGIGLFVTSSNLKEFEIDYTGDNSSSPCYQCAQPTSWNNTCQCSIQFTLNQSYEGDIYMYYSLTNFYQNHRRYVKSRDDRQLNGDISALTNPSQQCEPFDMKNSVPIAPCGAIANSLFNDTMKLYYVGRNETYSLIPLAKKNIAWWTDKNAKFKNPSGNNLSEAFKDTAKPFSWRRPVYELDLTDPDNNGFINEDFIVWMRTAALPNFRKLYRIIQKKDDFTPTLPAGEYMLSIDYHYPVLNFNGRKRMVLSTISWMGGKNPFLGIVYMIVGSLSFFMGLVLLFVHYKYGNQNDSTEFPD